MPSKPKSALFTYLVVPGTRIIGSVCAACHRTVAWSSRPKHLETAEAAHVCPGVHVRTIMVVDDYAPHAYALERIAVGAGFRVISTRTGSEAIERAAEKPDLILLDIGLPDVNGFEVCRRLKASPKTASIPVVFITANHATQEAIIEGERCGAAGFLFYPVTAEDLLPLIERSLCDTEQSPSGRNPSSAGFGVN